MDEIRIVPYDPQWPSLFAAEAARLRGALTGGLILDVEHIGSTAVPGMPAKPVIDLLVRVRTVEQARHEAVPVLEALGYAFWYDNPRRDRLFFVKGLTPQGPRTHHVHMVEQGTPDRRVGGEDTFRDLLLFRDYLRDHPDEAQRYALLKQELADRFSEDREAYTEAKTEYVRGVLGPARRARSGRGAFRDRLSVNGPLS